MKTLLYLRQQDSFEELEKRITEMHKDHEKQFGEGRYYPFAYGALCSSYRWLYEDYIALKNEYEANKKAT